MAETKEVTRVYVGEMYVTVTVPADADEDEIEDAFDDAGRKGYFKVRDSYDM